MADHDDLEDLALRLEESGDYRVLRRVPVVERYADDDATTKRLGLIVDVETTGLDPTRDKIIELAILPFDFSSEGVLYGVRDSYAGFEDPGMPIPKEISRLTGITDDDVRGQTLDDDAVAALAADASLVIAHNAGFDRRFLERRFPVFVDTPWGCSREQVPWAAEGLRSRSLDYLLYRFGYFFDGHRALNDCQAVLHLLSPDPADQRSADPAGVPRERPAAGLADLGAGYRLRPQGPAQGARLSLEQWRGRPSEGLVPRRRRGRSGRRRAVPRREDLRRSATTRPQPDRLPQPVQ